MRNKFDKNNIICIQLKQFIHWHVEELFRHYDLVESARTWAGSGCEFDSWECMIYIISHVQRTYDYLGPFRVLCVQMA